MVLHVNLSQHLSWPQPPGNMKEMTVLHGKKMWSRKMIVIFYIKSFLLTKENINNTNSRLTVFHHDKEVKTSSSIHRCLFTILTFVACIPELKSNLCVYFCVCSFETAQWCQRGSTQKEIPSWMIHPHPTVTWMLVILCIHSTHPPACSSPNSHSSCTNLSSFFSSRFPFRLFLWLQLNNSSVFL